MFTTSIITSKDVLENLGVNLDFELKNDDNPSNRVQLFLNTMDDWCRIYLKKNYGVNDVIEDLATWRIDYYKKGLLKQIEYVLRNGKTTIDNGFIRETGLIVNFDNVALGHDAYMQFWAGAFCNIH
jgi:hypothetical protein